MAVRYKGPQFSKNPPTRELEKHQHKCEVCNGKKYLDAAAAVFRCERCEVKDALVGEPGRTDLGGGAVVDWHAAGWLTADPDLLFGDLEAAIPTWVEADDRVAFPEGEKLIAQPRLVAYVAKGLAMGQTYSYPGLEEPLKPEEMPPSVDGIRRRVEETMFGSLDLNVFDSAHLNMYRGEHDHVSWHSDDDVALYGNDPIIASVSLGATRRFVVRTTASPSTMTNFSLENGDLLVMHGATQRLCEHSVRKEHPNWKVTIKPRINLTFRRIDRSKPLPPLRVPGTERPPNKWLPVPLPPHRQAAASIAPAAAPLDWHPPLVVPPSPRTAARAPPPGWNPNASPSDALARLRARAGTPPPEDEMDTSA